MKIRAKRDFQYGNENLEEGKVYELPDSVAEHAIEKDYAAYKPPPRRGSDSHSTNGSQATCGSQSARGSHYADGSQTTYRSHSSWGFRIAPVGLKPSAARTWLAGPIT
ncbi:hypothetical protein AKJ65_06400 [candidate division MSBL1 archaeon SCGC-AAA259E19]|uniref:Uncharacterized protein n=1 Tax=candidate division MSBL1 archaeon SCGC-AAA259E19 TaxID=1698264 RepID=A0A133UGI8_9EURY|nr:hypothetical protein AKJ65_06400 [candidate division MSBL1 archaeon SCGC-AAA259E19]